MILQLSAPVAPAPATDRELREAYVTASRTAERERARGTRERLHTLGTAIAVCCGLALNLPLLSVGLEIGLSTFEGLTKLI